MANRIPSNLVKAQAILLGKFQSSELRYRNPITYLAFKLSGAIMFPNWDVLRTREDRTVETNYKVRSARALGTGGRTHNHTGVKGDTATMTLAWQSYDDAFNMSLTQADNSLYSAEQQLAQELETVVANFAEGLETIATAYIFNNRSGVNGATAGGTFDATDDVFQIAEADQDTAIQISKSVMYVNKYSDSNLMVFCDTVSYNLFEKTAAQGAQNATNWSFQFNGVTFVHSVELGALGSGLVGAYAKGFWVIAEQGTFGVLPWIPRVNRRGTETMVDAYSTIMNPIDGFSYALHMYDTGADDSGNNGSVQDTVKQYEISIDQAFESAPLSTANETVFQAFAIV
jgi:hypothetical protein